jgi:hypothetical protein
MDNDVVEAPVVPKPPRPKPGPGNGRLKEIGIEIAALAYVAMENGTYIYHNGKTSVSGSTVGVPNHTELMRLAGYSKGSLKFFDTTLGKKPEFWQLVALYRIRREDPMFRKEQRNIIIGELAGKITEELYEAIFYYPHTIPFRDKLAALKTIVDIGYRVEPEKKRDKTSELLDRLKPEQRQEALSGMEENLKKQLEQLSVLKGAHAAADREEP